MYKTISVPANSGKDPNSYLTHKQHTIS